MVFFAEEAMAYPPPPHIYNSIISCTPGAELKGDFLFWKMNKKQICWELSLSCCSESGIPEEKMNSYQSQLWQSFNRTFTALLARLKCCNTSSWSWTGESVHLELGRRPLKRLMVHLVKFLHLKVPKYPGNVNKRKFEGVLPQVIFEPCLCSKAGPTQSLLLRRFGTSSTAAIWKARQVMHLSA